jgi:hypothetical protein
MEPAMKLLFSPKGIVLTAAFLSFLLSVYIWFVLEDHLLGIYVGLWVPSILSTGTLVLSPPWRSDQKR